MGSGRGAVLNCGDKVRQLPLYGVAFGDFRRLDTRAVIDDRCGDPSSGCASQIHPDRQ
jgi:hypothetical protein